MTDQAGRVVPDPTDPLAEQIASARVSVAMGGEPASWSSAWIKRNLAAIERLTEQIVIERAQLRVERDELRAEVTDLRQQVQRVRDLAMQVANVDDPNQRLSDNRHGWNWAMRDVLAALGAAVQTEPQPERCENCGGYHPTENCPVR